LVAAVFLAGVFFADAFLAGVFFAAVLVSAVFVADFFVADFFVADAVLLVAVLVVAFVDALAGAAADVRRPAVTSVSSADRRPVARATALVTVLMAVVFFAAMKRPSSRSNHRCGCSAVRIERSRP
jgi:hypothetical protein